jgi:hypothetical protein
MVMDTWEGRDPEVLQIRRHQLQLRHSAALTRLMETRRDLRGVHALADFVDDAVRWSV